MDDDIRRKMGGACMYSVMKANMNGQKLKRYWSVGPSNGTTLSSEISYLSDDTPSRYRSTPRDNNLRAAGVGRNRHCWRKKKVEKKNEDLQHDNIKIVHSYNIVVMLYKLDVKCYY